MSKIDRIHRKFWWLIRIGVGVFLLLLLSSGTRLLFCKQPDDVWAANAYNYSNPSYYGRNESGFIIARKEGNPPKESDKSETPYSTYLQELLCGGEMKFTDLIIALFTYCLIIVAWHQTRISDETTKRSERAYIIGRGPYGLPKPKSLLEKVTPEIETWPEADHFREPRRMTIQNYGKTPGFITDVYWGWCDPNDFPKENGKDIAVSVIIARWISDQRYFPLGNIEKVKDPSDTYPPTEGGWRTFRQIEFNRTEKIGKIFFGVIEYMDVFKESHYSAFKMRLEEKYSPSMGDTHATDWD